MPDLGQLGGVLAVWDPEKGELKHAARNVVQDQSIVSLAYRDGVVYGGTSIYGGQSATPPTQPEAKLFAWSVRENRLLWEIVPAPGKPAIPALAFDRRGRLWGIAGGEVFAVNVAARKVVSKRHPLVEYERERRPLPQQEGRPAVRRARGDGGVRAGPGTPGGGWCCGRDLCTSSRCTGPGTSTSPRGRGCSGISRRVGRCRSSRSVTGTCAGPGP